MIILRIVYVKQSLKKMDRQRNDQAQNQRKYLLFFLSAVVTSILLGMVIPLFIPYIHNVFLHFVLIIFIIGIAAGATAALFPSTLLAVTYTLFITLPLISYFLTLPDTYAFISALAIFMLVVVLTSIAQVTQSYMLEVYQQRKQLQMKEEELDALFTQTPTPIFYFDKELKIKKYNEAFQDFFEISSETTLDGFDLTQLKSQEAVEMMREVLKRGEPREYDGPYFSTFTSKDYWLRAKIAPLFNDEGELIGGIASFQDRTLEIKSIEYLEELATLDPLTELGNRRSFLQHLEHLVDEQKKGDLLSLLFYLDLNHFKPINDTLGHHFGDLVLKEVSRLLKSLVPDEAMVFRLGGDEFVILHPKCCPTEEEARKRGAVFARKINKTLSKKLIIGDYRLSIHASIGIIVITPQMHNSDEIIRRADISMYQAKSRHLEYAFYDSSMDENQRKNFFIHQEMARNDFLNQLVLYFQPLHALGCSKLVGAEALIRWHHPTLGLLTPAEFISLAIESGEIQKIGHWIREETCKAFIYFRENGCPLEFISTNVDARELGYNNFTKEILDLLEKYDLDPSNLVLEITENSLIDNFERYHIIFETLKKAGVRWAIDDFGIGYSSLSYLERLSFSILKIDQSFITSMVTSSNAAFLIGHIVDIAAKLGYQVVAEGIESRAQMQKLLEISPNIMCQGYYFGHPLPREEFCKLLPAKEA